MSWRAVNDCAPVLSTFQILILIVFLISSGLKAVIREKVIVKGMIVRGIEPKLCSHSSDNHSHDISSKVIVWILPQPIRQAGQREGELLLDFGAVERGVLRPSRALVFQTRTTPDARLQLRMASGQELADLQARESLGAGQMP